MSESHGFQDDNFEFGWRKASPFARRAAMTGFSWQDPSATFLWSVVVAAPFILAAVLAPALLSLAPTMAMLAPIAEARAVAAGEASILANDAPFLVLLIMTADLFTDAPGRIHLISKAIAAGLIAYPLAYFASTRFPVIQAVLLTAAMAAFVAAPFSAAPEIGLSLLIVCAVSFISASADDRGARARVEGAVAGVLLFALWMMSPVFSLAAFLLLSACPFLSGGFGLSRYAATLAVFAILGGVAEMLAPGLNMVRAEAASGIFSIESTLSAREGGGGIGAMAMGAILVITSAAVFGGREHRKNWIAAALGGVVLVLAARIAGANALPAFILAAALACFSTASPFYDGLFRSHDRASVSVSMMTAGLTLFWTSVMIVHSAGQFALQYETTKAAPDHMRSNLALVQPGGPTIARWVEEGRFSTPEAREFFALTPVDQSAMLLEAAARAKEFTNAGVDVAFLTESDTACVVGAARLCRADGREAANAAKVLFVPRLDLDAASAELRGRSEAMLYSDFKLVERTALWEIWVRRGVSLPARFGAPAASALYR